MKFSRCFERVLELRETGKWPASHFIDDDNSYYQHHNNEWDGKDEQWDQLLEQVWFMARDMTQERKWKREAARAIAEEATTFTSNRKNFNPRPVTKLTIPTTRRFLLETNQVYSPGSGLVNIPLTLDALSITTNNVCSLRQFSSKPLSPPHISGPTGNNRQPPWSPLEDAMLLKLVREGEIGGWEAIRFSLNFFFHGGRPVRGVFDTVHHHAEITTNSPVTPSIPPHNARIHLARMSVMNSLATKLITARSAMPPKKLNLAAHPSHEAAARRANQNISKLFTPHELALRRVQRTRYVAADPTMTAFLSLPIATPANGGPGPGTGASTSTSATVTTGAIPPNQQAINATAAVITQAQAAGMTIVRPSVGGVNSTVVGSSPQVHRTMTVPGALTSTMGIPTTNTAASAIMTPNTTSGTIRSTVIPHSMGGAPTSLRPPLMTMPAMTLQQQQQQKQALLSKSQHLGNYLSNMQTTIPLPTTSTTTTGKILTMPVGASPSIHRSPLEVAKEKSELPEPLTRTESLTRINPSPRKPTS